ELARTRGEQAPFGARTGEARARFDLDQVAASDEREQRIWHALVRERRHVSRAAWQALAAEIPPLAPKPRRYRFRAGEPPVLRGARLRPGRRPPNTVNSTG